MTKEKSKSKRHKWDSPERRHAQCEKCGCLRHKHGMTIKYVDKNNQETKKSPVCE